MKYNVKHDVWNLYKAIFKYNKYVYEYGLGWKYSTKRIKELRQ